MRLQNWFVNFFSQYLYKWKKANVLGVYFETTPHFTPHRIPFTSSREVYST